MMSIILRELVKNIRTEGQVAHLSSSSIVKKTGLLGRKHAFSHKERSFGDLFPMQTVSMHQKG